MRERPPLLVLDVRTGRYRTVPERRSLTILLWVVFGSVIGFGVAVVGHAWVWW